MNSANLSTVLRFNLYINVIYQMNYKSDGQITTSIIIIIIIR